MTPSLMHIVLADRRFRAKVGEKKYEEWANKVRGEGGGTIGDIFKEV